MIGVRAVAAGLEAHRVDGRVDLRRAEHCSICSPGSPFETSIVSQPKLRACSRRSGMRSPTITTEAPRSCAECAAARPTGPAPAM